MRRPFDSLQGSHAAFFIGEALATGSMLLLIDGYNLLHQSGLMGRGRGDRWLQRARERLLRQLARSLDEALTAQTCVVFDAEAPPPDRPHEYVEHGIRVIYAVGYPEADDLVEELIARHAAPQRLTVVSSDHRLQRAARRRRARAFDSDSWYQRLLETGPQLAIRWPPDTPQHDQPPPTAPEKPEGVPSEREIASWITWFEQGETIEPVEQAERIGGPVAEPANNELPTPHDPPAEAPKPKPKQKQKRASRKGKTSADRGTTRQRRSARRPDRRKVDRYHDDPGRLGSPDKQIDPSAENPFPEGYGEDLLDDEQFH